MMNNSRTHLYAISVCEDSGDALGAGLVAKIIQKDPQARFVGIYGPRIRAIIGSKGQVYDMQEFAVMGVVEVLKSLPQLLSKRKKFKQYILNCKPDVFIGIDAPDFNLNVEGFLKENNIPTVHYVSPSVWAWREKRVYKVKASVDLLLSILPFEKDFYNKYEVPCVYVGHRIAREIKWDAVTVRVARMTLRFAEEAMDCNQIIGVFPGSRKAEISFLTPVFAKAAYNLKKRFPVMRFICASPTKEKAKLIAKLWRRNAPHIPLIIWVGHSREVMSACNAMMISSGTATLEAMFLRKRMVVCYIVNQLTAAVGRVMLKIKNFSLPNILSGKEIVPELIQENCTSQNIENEIFKILTTQNVEQIKEFIRIHKMMNINSDEIAANAIMELLNQRCTK